MRSLLILGCSGSIGRQCVDLLREYPGRFRVAGLTAGSSLQVVAELAAELDVPAVALADASKADELAALLPARTRVEAGPEAADELVATMARHAQDPCAEVLWAHVDLYVNPWTLDLGEAGARAIGVLSERARAVGFAPAELRIEDA